MSLKNSNDTIGNRTSDINQPRHRLPRSHVKVLNIYNMDLMDSEMLTLFWLKFTDTLWLVCYVLCVGIQGVSRL